MDSERRTPGKESAEKRKVPKCLGGLRRLEDSILIALGTGREGRRDVQPLTASLLA